MWAMVMNDEIREILDGLFETLENDLLSRSQYKILLDYITNLQKEIDRLNNDIKTSLKENEAKEKVIKKQDYVINELEKWLIEYRTFIDIPDYYEEGIIDCLDEVLDKLKELKEKK